MIMSNFSLTEPKNEAIEHKINLSWKDSPSVRRLLDAVSSILAEEYIIVAKQKPDVFLKQGGSK